MDIDQWGRYGDEMTAAGMESDGNEISKYCRDRVGMVTTSTGTDWDGDTRVTVTCVSPCSSLLRSNNCQLCVVCVCERQLVFRVRLIPCRCPIPDTIRPIVSYYR